MKTCKKTEKTRKKNYNYVKHFGSESASVCESAEKEVGEIKGH